MATVLDEDLLDDNSFKEYGDDLEDLDADAEEALLGIGSDDETHGNEGYEGTGEDVEYVDEEGNPVEINEGDEVEFVEYSDSGHETETYESGVSATAEDVLDIVVDADLEFDDSVVQEDVKYEPPQKKPRLPMSARLGSHPVQNVELPKQGEGHHEHAEAEEEQSQNAEPIDEDEDVVNSVSESEDEEEDEEEEDEASGRGRFHSERPNIIQLSAAKKRTNIPDTLDGIIQSNDVFRPDSFRDKRGRPNWEHSRQDQQQQQQQQYRNRDYRNRTDKERNTWSSHGNKSASQSVHASSKLDQSSAPKSSHNNQEFNSSAPPSAGPQSSLLGQPPNLLVRDVPPRDAKEPQAPRKILINPHFKGSINASAPSAARVAGSSSWIDQSHQPAGRNAPLLEAAPPFQQAQLANYTGPTIHQQHPAEISQSLMAEQRHHHQQQQQHHSFPQFNPTQQPTHPPLVSAHYSELPVSSFQQHNSRIGAPPYSTPNAVPSSLSSVPLPHQYPPVDVCMPPPHQMHHQNDPWHQNVSLPPTHVQPEIQRGGVWNNPPPPVHQFAVASVQNTVPQRWPPPQQSQTINQSSYNNPLELHHQQHQQLPHQLPAVSLPDMRQPPPNFNGPRMASQENSTPWQGQMQRTKHHLHGSPLSVPRYSHPPPPLLANVPPNPRFLVPVTSPLKQLTPRMPFNNKNSANANNLRQRNAGFSRGLLPEPLSLWSQTAALMSSGQNLQTQFPRKRPLNPGVGVLGRVIKGHQQVVSRRQFQVISNIKEVQLVDTLPQPSPSPVASPAKIQSKQDAVPAIAADDEDEETRRYRQQIELQKKKREEIMRIKEQRRQLMALQRRKLLVEQQKADADVGGDGNGLLNFQTVAVPQKGAVVSKVKAASFPQTSQQSPLSLRATGQPIMSLVSRNKKQVVVRRVSPQLTSHVTSPTFLVQHPGFMQSHHMISPPRPASRVFLKPPNFMSQVSPRHALMQRVVPVKQIVAQLTGMPAVTMASPSKVKPMSQQQAVVGALARRVLRNPAGVSQTTPSSPNIVSKKFPAQAVKVEPKKSVQQQQQKQKQMTAIKQNAQQRAVTVGQQPKRTVVMNSADVKLLQPKQQPVAPVVGQQTQRRVMAAKVVPARVQIDNLALSTSEAVVHKLCQNVGPVENVVLHRDKRTAVVTFRNQQHAHEFMNKYQRRMLDLSLMNISMVT